MAPNLHPQLAKIAQAVRLSTELEKLAGAAPEQEARVKAATAKVRIDDEIFGMVGFSLKTASADTTHPVQRASNEFAELAVGLHSLHKLGASDPEPADGALAEATAKLATVGAIERMLSILPKNMSPAAEKLATELRVINRSYGVAIMNDLVQ